MKQFSLSATGGTFDRFHKGHAELLKTAFSISEKVIVGITTKRLTENKTFPHLILPYQKRKKELFDFLKKENFLKKAEITTLYDPYGPLLKNKKIEAVVVGPRADKEVLQKLKGKIKIIHCQTIRSEDNHYLSSTRIRKGEVSREGFLYLKEKGPFVLPDFLRPKLRVPFGKLTKKFDLGCHCEPCQRWEKSPRSGIPLRGTIPLVSRLPRLLISVGDASTRFLNKHEVKIDLAVVDFKIQRKKVIESFSDLGFPKEKDLSKFYRIANVQNNPGTISASLIENIKAALDRLLKIKALKSEGCKTYRINSFNPSEAPPQAGRRRREIIKIDGEDDLAVIPAVLYSPLETMVVYGSPNEGLVVVEVSEEKKEEMKKLLKAFTSHPQIAKI